MPWYVIESKQCPAGKPWAVIQQNNGKLMGCHKTKFEAGQQAKALYAQEAKK
jgi:hypothetical protein